MTVVGHKTLGNGPCLGVADVDEPVRAAGHEEAGRVGAPDRAVADGAVPLEAADLRGGLNKINWITSEL